MRRLRLSERTFTGVVLQSAYLILLAVNLPFSYCRRQHEKNSICGSFDFYPSDIRKRIFSDQSRPKFSAEFRQKVLLKKRPDWELRRR